MAEIVERLKDIWVLFWVLVVSVTVPIHTAIWALLAFGTLNFFVGYRTDVYVNKKEFSQKKAWDAIKLFMFYGAVIFMISASLLIFGEESIAKNVVEYITIIVCYIYLLNIFRNAKKLFPNSKSISFVYDFLSTELITIIMERIGLYARSITKKDKKDSD